MLEAFLHMRPLALALKVENMAILFSSRKAILTT